MRVKLGIGEDGRIALPARDAEALGLAEGDEAELHTARGSFALVARPGGAGHAYFAGSLSALTVPEVFHFVFGSLKSGVLLFAFGPQAGRGAGSRPEELRRKSVYFRDGQVVFASSSDAADRLGAVLARTGLVPREELERCGRQVRADRPLGQVLVDERLLTAGQLYTGMTTQVREIVLEAFLETEGEFTFVEGPYDERNAVKLTERTKDLLLEGMRRIEEVEGILREEVPDLEAVVRGSGASARGAGPAEERLLSLVDASRTARQLLDQSLLGRYLGLQALAGLVRRGAVARLKAAPRNAPPEREAPALPAGPPARASGPFETYRRIFKHIFGEIRKAQPEARQRLNSYFDRLPETQRPVFENVRVDGEGEVDVALVLLNVNQGGAFKGAAARARALEALEGFLAFALFEVKNCLPRQKAEAVLREVGRMQVGQA